MQLGGAEAGPPGTPTTALLRQLFSSPTVSRFRKLMIPSADLKMRGTLGAGPRTVAVNDCAAKLKGDGTVAAITEKETHF